MCLLKARTKFAALILMLLLFGGTNAVTAQQSPNQSDPQSQSELLGLPGRTIARGRNTVRIGVHRIATYLIEELTLPRPVEVEVQGVQTRVNKAWRVTITGGRFAVRALPPVIWIDDVSLGIGQENEQLTAISVITFDRSLLREGATISLSYGEDEENRIALPERLFFSSGRQTR